MKAGYGTCRLRERGLGYETTAEEVAVSDLGDFADGVHEWIKDPHAAGGGETSVTAGLVVALGMLRKDATEQRRKRNGRIFLITDAAIPFDVSVIPGLQERMKNMEVSLNVIGIGCDAHLTLGGEPQLADAEYQNPIVESPRVAEAIAHLKGAAYRQKRANELVLQSLCAAVGGSYLMVHEALTLLTGMKRKEVGQVSQYNGTFSLSDDVHIPVKLYVRTRELTRAQFKSVYFEDETSRRIAGTLQRDSASYLLGNVDQEVREEERVKAYKYGTAFVPFSAIDEEKMSYGCARSLKLIGFTPRSLVRRHHFMDTVSELHADKGEEPALALASLVQALRQLDHVAIARFVRQNNKEPIIVALLPHAADGYDTLLLVHLPFVNDLRLYPFSDLSPDALPPKWQPTAEQLAATDALVDSLDLGPRGVAVVAAATGEEEEEEEEGEGEEEGGGERRERERQLLAPEDTPNPYMQSFYAAVAERVNAASPALPLTATARAREQLATHAALRAAAAAEIRRFAEAFPLRAAARKARAKRARTGTFSLTAKARLTPADVGLLDPVAMATTAESTSSVSSSSALSASPVKPGAGGLTSLSAILSAKQSTVGAADPIGDFFKMIRRKDADLTESALSQLGERVRERIEASVGDSAYEGALAMLRAMREGALANGEGDWWNRYLRSLRSTLSLSLSLWATGCLGLLR